MPDDADSYYSAADTEAEKPAASAAPDKPKSEDKDEPEADTALLPKSLFPGEPPAVGDVCQFKVEHLWESEVEVSYMKEGGEGSPARRKGRSSMDTATDAFDQMANPAATPE